MTVEEVIARVERIRSCRYDNEVAHGMEDALHTDVLRAIADGDAADPAECAREALKTNEISFVRWYA